MRYSVLAKAVLASVLLSFQIQAKADPIIIDPSIFNAGIKIGGIFSDVIFSTAQGSMEIVGTTVTIPLHLTSGAMGPVFSDGMFFSHEGGSVWSAGQCCGGDQVLRMDFLDPVSFVSMLFSPDDTDTGILQIFAYDGTLLGEEIFRSSDPFSLALEGPGIAFALATFGDTGQLGVLTFSVPEPKTLALFG